MNHYYDLLQKIKGTLLTAAGSAEPFEYIISDVNVDTKRVTMIRLDSLHAKQEYEIDVFMCIFSRSYFYFNDEDDTLHHVEFYEQLLGDPNA